MWHGYIAVQRLNITEGQWSRVLDVLETWGPVVEPSPARLLHQAVAVDGTVVIYEAAFDVAKVSVVGFRQVLADEFGVLAGEIGVTSGGQTFVSRESPFWTFDYGGQNRVRVGVFGGLGAIHVESLIEVVAYMLANHAEWFADG